MAQVSPGVEVIERDASLIVPVGLSSTGAVVVHAQRGPINKVIDITNTSDYISNFGFPDVVNQKFWWTANKFLEGSSALKVVRVEDDLKLCAGTTVGFSTPTTAAVTEAQRLTAVPSPKRAGSYPLTYDTLYSDSSLNLGYDSASSADDLPYVGEAGAPLGGPSVSGSSEILHVYSVGAGPFYESIKFAVVSYSDFITLQGLKRELAESVLDLDKQAVIAKYWTGVAATTAASAAPYLSESTLIRQDIITSQPKTSNGVTVNTANTSSGWAIDSGMLEIYTSPEYGPDRTITGINPNDGTNIYFYDEYLFFVFNEKGQVDNIYLCSTNPDKKDAQGNSMFGPTLVNGNNKYVYLFSSYSEISSKGLEIKWSVGQTPLQGADGLTGYTAANSTRPSTITGVANTSSIGDLTDEITIAWNTYFSNKEQIEVDILLDCDYVDSIKQTMDNLAKNVRKDCVAILNIPQATIMNVTTGKVVSSVYSNIKTYIDSTLLINSSYSAIYGNYFKIFDTYQSKEIWVPVTGWVGATIARTDTDYAQWWAPAGLTRGILTGITDVALNPNKAQRDILYINKVNPIANFIGQGIVIWGQKTLQTKPSAFDRINVRRLFLYIERAIEKLSRYFVFELNDDTTRTRFRGLVNNFLSEVKTKRGVYDYLVVADSTNNTADVIDRNEFVAEILVKPTRVMEFIKLIFTAVSTGTDFSELVGKG